MRNGFVSIRSKVVKFCQCCLTSCSICGPMISHPSSASENAREPDDTEEVERFGHRTGQVISAPTTTTTAAPRPTTTTTLAPISTTTAIPMTFSQPAGMPSHCYPEVSTLVEVLSKDEYGCERKSVIRVPGKVQELRISPTDDTKPLTMKVEKGE